MNCFRFQFSVSHVYESDHFCRIRRICGSLAAAGSFNPIQALAVTLMLNARHLFYGISMLDKFRGLGWKRIYLIFGMCDETFSINYAAAIPEDIDRGWFMFFVTLFNHIYWFAGATLGGLFGSLIRFSTEGLDFVMTAMFTVIFLDQWKKESQHLSSLLPGWPFPCSV